MLIDGSDQFGEARSTTANNPRPPAHTALQTYVADKKVFERRTLSRLSSSFSKCTLHFEFSLQEVNYAPVK